jgi:hypothetical protein
MTKCPEIIRVLSNSELLQALARIHSAGIALDCFSDGSNNAPVSYLPGAFAMRACAILPMLLVAILPIACGGEPTPPSKPKNTYTRQEFEQAVIGKKPSEVLTLLGKPESITKGKNNEDSDDPNFGGSIRYETYQVSVSESEGKSPAKWVIIQFTDGKASSVQYF